MYFSRNHSAWLSRSCTNLKGLSFHSIMCVCCSKWIEDPLPRCQNLNDYSKRKIRKRTYAKQLRCNVFFIFFVSDHTFYRSDLCDHFECCQCCQFDCATNLGLFIFIFLVRDQLRRRCDNRILPSLFLVFRSTIVRGICCRCVCGDIPFSMYSCGLRNAGRGRLFRSDGCMILFSLLVLLCSALFCDV